jgi:hypothetical protein
MFGIDFMSVISRWPPQAPLHNTKPALNLSIYLRGSQFRVESLMRRLASSQNFVLMAPSKQQVPSCSSRTTLNP